VPSAQSGKFVELCTHLGFVTNALPGNTEKLAKQHNVQQSHKDAPDSSKTAPPNCHGGSDVLSCDESDPVH
jgi:hypothetical protein